MWLYVFRHVSCLSPKSWEEKNMYFSLTFVIPLNPNALSILISPRQATYNYSSNIVRVKLHPIYQFSQFNQRVNISRYDKLLLNYWIVNLWTQFHLQYTPQTQDDDSLVCVKVNALLRTAEGNLSLVRARPIILK